MGSGAFFLNAQLLGGTLETQLIDAGRSRAALLNRFRDGVAEKILTVEAVAGDRWRSMQAE